MALAEATPAEMIGDVALAVRRRPGLPAPARPHRSRPSCTRPPTRPACCCGRTCPLQWGYARGVRSQARRQAREAVDLLAHHPSVFLWCGHNEPHDHRRRPRHHRRRRGDAVGWRPASLASQALPTWNRTLLDRHDQVGARAQRRHPPGHRPLRACYPHLPQLDGTDSHLWFGWKVGDERDLPAFLARWPRMARFVSEFGRPGGAGVRRLRRARPLARPGLGRPGRATTACIGPSSSATCPPEAFATYDDWQEATQRYQARLLRYQVETPATAEVPPHRRLRPVLLRRQRRPGSPARCWATDRRAQARLRRAARPPASR